MFENRALGGGGGIFGHKEGGSDSRMGQTVRCGAS